MSAAVQQPGSVVADSVHLQAAMGKTVTCGVASSSTASSIK